MPRAIVTGCAGFIGSHLVDYLLENNWDVVGIDNFHPYYSRKLKEHNLLNAKKSDKFHFVEGSILSQNDLCNLPDQIDYLFHFAAIAGVRNSILHPDEYFKINVEGTKQLFNYFKKIKKIIFASTSSVYGEVSENDFPVSENHKLNPISPYGESKKQAEEFCQTFSNEKSVELAILRFYTVFGPRQRPDEAFTKFIRLILNKKSNSIADKKVKILRSKIIEKISYRSTKNIFRSNIYTMIPTTMVAPMNDPNPLTSPIKN